MYSALKPFEPYSMLNLANEWGDGTDGTCRVGQTAWRSAYVTAVQNMRAAGFTQTLVIDAGGSGTDEGCIVNHGQAIYDADPQHNILFSWHNYGNSPSGTLAAVQALAAARTATAGAFGGFPVMIGEFGPSGVYGGTTTALQTIQAANAASLGWLAWAYDDSTAPFNMQPAPHQGDGLGPSLTNGVPTNGTPAPDLTTYGNDVIFNYPESLFNAKPPKATAF
jgi:hypothetical protein